MGRETIKQKIAKMEQKIEELTKQRDTLQQLVYVLDQEKRDLQDSKDTDFAESSIYQDMQRKMDMQEQKIKNLESENKRLKEKLKHNARHAGRKPDNLAIQQKRQQFAALLAEHRPMREIMQIMHISKSTYYNYYRHTIEQNINYLDSTDN